MVRPPVGVNGSPMGPGFTLQMGGFSPASPVPPQQWGPGQQLGGGPMGPPGMGAVEWETQVQQIVDAGGNYGGCAQHTVIGSCCAGGPGPWLGPENQYPQGRGYYGGPGGYAQPPHLPPHQVVLPGGYPNAGQQASGPGHQQVVMGNVFPVQVERAPISQVNPFEVSAQRV